MAVQKAATAKPRRASTLAQALAKKNSATEVQTEVATADRLHANSFHGAGSLPTKEAGLLPTETTVDDAVGGRGAAASPLQRRSLQKVRSSGSILPARAAAEDLPGKLGGTDLESFIGAAASQARRSTTSPRAPCTPVLALSGKNGCAVKVSKWKMSANMVDRQTQGAHFDYVVGNLPSACAPEDADRADYDAALADAMSRRYSDSPAAPLAKAPNASATNAFPDRAGRLREGRGARRALTYKILQPKSEPHDHGLCTCSVCCPFGQQAAGQPSHLVHYHRVPRCATDHHPIGVSAELGPRHALGSTSLARSMQHLDGNPGLLEDEERTFLKKMGRKAKPATPISPGGGTSMSHRSFSVDDVRAAGDYDRERSAATSAVTRGPGRQAWQDSSGAVPLRTGVALALEPREGDPPLPTQIVACVKAPGLFKDGYTDQSTLLTQHFNAEIYRFADPLRVRRGKSLPPPLHRDCAGVPTGEYGKHHLQCRGNPVTMEGHACTEKKAALGSSTSRSGSTSFRSNWGNTSAAVSRLLNHELSSKVFAMESKYRLQNEPEFAALCDATQDRFDEGRTWAKTVKDRMHGTDVRNQMVWDEA